MSQYAALARPDAGTTETVLAIAHRVSHYFAVPLIDIISHRRDSRSTLARQVVMYIARHHTTRTTTAIGLALGNRDHTTIMHGESRIAERMKHDNALALRIAACAAIEPVETL